MVIGVLLALLLSAWIGGIAILSVQNATAVSLKFLVFQSIQMPLGLLLTFAVITGLMGTVLLLPLWRGRAQGRKLKSKATKSNRVKFQARPGANP